MIENQKKLREFNDFLHAANIDIEYHKDIFEFDPFCMYNSKINLSLYPELRNQIYWLSASIHAICMTNYDIEYTADNEAPNNGIKIAAHNILIFHPMASISSEMCGLMTTKYLYQPLSSVLCRQAIEHITTTLELNAEKVENFTIFEACVEAENMQNGAKSLNIPNLNTSNRGILKVFRTSRKYSKLAKKYRKEFVYNYFSGDVHMTSSISKLLIRNPYKKSLEHELYMQMILSILKDCLDFVVANNIKFDTSKIDMKALGEIGFMKIEDSRKNV